MQSLLLCLLALCGHLGWHATAAVSHTVEVNALKPKLCCSERRHGALWKQWWCFRQWRGGGEEDELQPASPRRAGSGGAAPRHRAAFVRVIILTLSPSLVQPLVAGVVEALVPPLTAGERLSLYPLLKSHEVTKHLHFYQNENEFVALSPRCQSWRRWASDRIFQLSAAARAPARRDKKTGKETAQVSARMFVCARRNQRIILQELSEACPKPGALPSCWNALRWLQSLCQKGGSLPKG